MYYFLIILLLCISCPSLHADEGLRVAFKPFSVLANQFLNTVQPVGIIEQLYDEYIYPFLNGSGVNLQFNQALILKFSKTFMGYSILICVGVAFIIFFSLIGFICCCCQTCCRSKKPNVSTSSVKTKRHVLNFFIFILTILIIIGAIVGIVSSTVLVATFKPMNSTTEKETNFYRSINKTFSSFNSFVIQIQNNLKTGGTAAVTTALNSSYTLVTNVSTNFISFVRDNLLFDSIIYLNQQLLKDVGELQAISVNLANEAKGHQNASVSFLNAIKEFNENITLLLKDTCNENCTELTNRTCDNNCTQIRPFLNVSANFDTNKINYTMDIMVGNISKEVSLDSINKSVIEMNEKNKTFDTEIRSSLKNSTNKLNETMSKLNLQSTIDNLSDQVREAGLSISQTTQNSINSIFSNQQAVYNYISIGKYVLSIIGGLILLICLFFLIGLSYGLCGGPNFEDASCCNKKTGRSMYLTSFILSLWFAWLIMLIVMIMFVIGGIPQTEGCRYISPESDPSYHEKLSKLIKKSTDILNLTIGSQKVEVPELKYQNFLNGCKDDKATIQQSLGIPNSYITNITDILNNQFVKPQLDNVIDQLKNINLPKVSSDKLTVVVNDIKKLSDKLQNPNENIAITELEKTVVDLVNLKSLQDGINVTASIWREKNYSQQAASLENLMKKLLVEINSMNSARITYLAVKKQYIATRSNMTTTNGHLQSSILTLQANLNNLNDKCNDTSKNCTDAVAILKDEIESKSKTILSTGINTVIVSLGSCTSLLTATTTAITIVCVDIIGSFNLIWMGYGWYLLFIIFLLSFAMAAGNIYVISHLEPSNVNYNRAYMPSNEFLKFNRPEKS